MSFDTRAVPHPDPMCDQYVTLMLLKCDWTIKHDCAIGVIHTLSGLGVWTQDHMWGRVAQHKSI